MRVPQHDDYPPHDIVLELAIRAKLQGRTQVDLEAEDGVSREAWRSWIHGRRDPGLRKLTRRAKTLGCKIIITVMPSLERTTEGETI